MSPVSCPLCGEKGNIPDQAIGKRVKCQKCGGSFVAGATTAAAPTASPAPIDAAKPAGDSIEVDGLDPSNWAETATAMAVTVDMQVPAFTASPMLPETEHADGPGRQYKVLTQRDRWFEGKFELARLEEALNHYARQGWVVRAMSTPHVTGFSGGPREEIVILLER